MIKPPSGELGTPWYKLYQLRDATACRMSANCSGVRPSPEVIATPGLTTQGVGDAGLGDGGHVQRPGWDDGG
ncbi:MAG: hypothetical protein ACLP3C_20645 [Mycobacterium sp.]|uniref:hypothetical protein n=1 Tax=Mycobacterium sp. TaxID=1785 RepID=UPI003C7831E8